MMQDDEFELEVEAPPSDLANFAIRKSHPQHQRQVPLWLVDIPYFLLGLVVVTAAGWVFVQVIL